MTVLFTNNARASLASAITDSETSIIVATGEGDLFPEITGAGQWFPVVLQDRSNYTNLEIARCTDRDGDTLTVIRAEEGTSALSFDAGDIVDLRLTAASIEEIKRHGELREALLAEATLNLDYVNNKYEVYEGPVDGLTAKPFHEIHTFTRASGASARNAIGGLTPVDVDQQRLVGNREGLLIEGERTRLNTVAAAPTVAEDVTVAATAHTISFSGTGTVELTGAATETLVGTGSQRVTLTFTPTAGTLTLTPSGTVENLQLEAGSFATSVILGEGSQVTRSADNASVDLGQTFNGDNFTYFIDYTVAENAFTSGDGLAVFSFGPSGSGADNSRLTLIVNSVKDDLAFVYRGLVVSAATGFTSGRHRAAVSVAKGKQLFYIDGILQEELNVSEGVVFDTLDFFADEISGNRETNITVKNSFITARAFTETELEALTAPEAN